MSAGITDPGYSASHKIFTDMRIHRASDCAGIQKDSICLRHGVITFTYVDRRGQTGGLGPPRSVSAVAFAR
jgi:hypothetical protein